MQRVKLKWKSQQSDFVQNGLLKMQRGFFLFLKWFGLHSNKNSFLNLTNLSLRVFGGYANLSSILYRIVQIFESEGLVKSYK